jgi:transposase
VGFSKRTAAEHLGTDYRTVDRYWKMTADECQEKVLRRERRKNLEFYDGVILDWLCRYPDMSASMVNDWLKEHYQVNVNDRTVRRHVQRLRASHNIPKTKSKDRQYQAVEKLPMGRQMQVDMGEIHLADARSFRPRKLIVISCVLSHSRYKWGKWFAAPPTAIPQALAYCVENSLYSAVDFRDALNYFAANRQEIEAAPMKNDNLVPFVQVSPAKRPLREYVALTRKGEN